MRYNLSDDDLAAIKAVPELLPLYVRLVADRTNHTDEAQEYAGHIAQAHEQYGSDEVEIDSDPIVSPGADPGIWVAAWVWVAHAEVDGYEWEDEDGVQWRGGELIEEEDAA